MHQIQISYRLVHYVFDCYQRQNKFRDTHYIHLCYKILQTKTTFFTLDRQQFNFFPQPLSESDSQPYY